MSSVFIRIVMNRYKFKKGNLVAKRLLETINKTLQSLLPENIRNVQEKCLCIEGWYLRLFTGSLASFLATAPLSPLQQLLHRYFELWSFQLGGLEIKEKETCECSN